MREPHRQGGRSVGVSGQRLKHRRQGLESSSNREGDIRLMCDRAEQPVIRFEDVNPM